VEGGRWKMDEGGWWMVDGEGCRGFSRIGAWMPSKIVRIEFIIIIVIIVIIIIIVIVIVIGGRRNRIFSRMHWKSQRRFGGYSSQVGHQSINPSTHQSINPSTHYPICSRDADDSFRDPRRWVFEKIQGKSDD
jgi:hypothetical protein